MTGDSPEVELVEPPERPRATRTVALALAAAALFAAIAVPDMEAGLGTTLVAFAAAAAIASARPVPSDPVVLGYTVAALLLAVTPSIRSAEWLIAVDLAAALALGALAVTRAVAWRRVFAAPFTVLARLRAAAGFVGGALLPRRGWLGRIGPVLRGAGLGSLLLLTFGTLFASADRAFAEIAGDLLVPDVDLSLVWARLIVFGAVLLGGGAYVLAGRRYAVTPEGTVVAPAPRLAAPEWAIALGLLDLLFAGFVAVQVTVLFGGARHVLETAGLSYAEYAREGFFQLVAVGLLTFGVVAAAVRSARRESARERRLLQLLLGALIVLTLVVLASAFQRLTLYESEFGYTRLRISVHATILWMAAIFLTLLVAGLTMRARWLPRVVVLLTAGALLSFSAVDPDRLVASHNVDRYLATGRIDLAYLQGLSADAVPELLRLPPALARCALAGHAGLGDGSVLEWNLGRARAEGLIPPGEGAVHAGACDGAQRAGLWP